MYIGMGRERERQGKKQKLLSIISDLNIELYRHWKWSISRFLREKPLKCFVQNISSAELYFPSFENKNMKFTSLKALFLIQHLLITIHSKPTHAY